MERTNKLNVRNFNQKILFEAELSGQISDGYWENARPLNHWVSWGKAEVTVATDNVGKNFYSHRSYKFDAQNLLSVVKTRMIFYVRMAEAIKDLVNPVQLVHTIRYLENLFDLIDAGKYLSEIKYKGVPSYVREGADKGDNFWVNRMRDFNQFIEDPKKLEILKSVEGSIYDKNKYSVRDLKKDLKDLNEIQYIRIA